MTEPALVSVIVPTHNRGAMLLEAMESVRSQSHRPIELIIVDDGSTDGTPERVVAWREQGTERPGLKVVFLRQDRRGAPSARNRGFAISTGKYVQYLDSDDLLHPDKLATAVAVLENDPSVQMVCSRMQRHEVSTGEVSLFEGADLEARPSPAEVALRYSSTLVPVFRREVIAAAGPWDERLLALQDWEFLARAMRHVDRVVQVPRVQCTARDHHGMRISRSSASQAAHELSRLLAVGSVLDAVRASGGHRATERRLLRLYVAAVLAAVRLGCAVAAREQVLKDRCRLRGLPEFTLIWPLLRVATEVPSGVSGRVLRGLRRLAGRA